MAENSDTSDLRRDIRALKGELQKFREDFHSTDKETSISIAVLKTEFGQIARDVSRGIAIRTSIVVSAITSAMGFILGKVFF